METSVTSVDCNHGVCPQTQGAIPCTITGVKAEWYSPPSILSIINSNGFTATLENINNSGLKGSLRFTSTIDKKCSDVIDTNSMDCTIVISGMSLRV